MNKVLEKYLGQVEKNLKSFPLSERVDIIKEIKSSMSELEQEGLTNEEIIARLGEPRDLANAYLGIEEKEEEKENLFASITFYVLVGIISMGLLSTLASLAFGFGLGGIAMLVATLVLIIDKIFGLNLAFIVNRGEFQYYVDNIFIEVFVYILMAIFMLLIAYLAYKLLVLYCKGVIYLKRKMIG